jgi:hypothetical protein
MLNRNFLRLIATSLFIFSVIIFHTNSAHGQSECDAFINICNIGSQTSWTLVRYVNDNTSEVGEPVPHTFYTVAQNPITTEWYRWTAPQNGTVVVDTAGTNPNAAPLLYRTPFEVDTLTAVYTGTTLANLVRIDESDNWFVNNPPDSSCSSQRPIPESFFSSCMQFPVVAGTTYHFQMDHLDNPQTLSTSLFHLNLHYLPPSAANVSIGGQVLDGNGNALSRVCINLTKPNGEILSAVTNSFGYYHFEGVDAGQTYILEAASKKYQFQNNPRVLNISDDVLGENFMTVTDSFYKLE